MWPALSVVNFGWCWSIVTGVFLTKQVPLQALSTLVGWLKTVETSTEKVSLHFHLRAKLCRPSQAISCLWTHSISTVQSFQLQPHFYMYFHCVQGYAIWCSIAINTYCIWRKYKCWSLHCTHHLQHACCNCSQAGSIYSSFWSSSTNYI